MNDSMTWTSLYSISVSYSMCPSSSSNSWHPPCAIDIMIKWIIINKWIQINILLNIVYEDSISLWRTAHKYIRIYLWICRNHNFSDQMIQNFNVVGICLLDLKKTERKKRKKNTQTAIKYINTHARTHARTHTKKMVFGRERKQEWMNEYLHFYICHWKCHRVKKKMDVPLKCDGSAKGRVGRQYFAECIRYRCNTLTLREQNIAVLYFLFQLWK